MSNENLTEDVLEKKLQCTSNDLQNKIEGLGNANKLRALLLPFCFGETETERRRTIPLKVFKSLKIEGFENARKSVYFQRWCGF